MAYDFKSAKIITLQSVKMSLLSQFNPRMRKWNGTALWVHITFAAFTQFSFYPNLFELMILWERLMPVYSVRNWPLNTQCGQTLLLHYTGSQKARDSSLLVLPQFSPLTLYREYFVVLVLEDSVAKMYLWMRGVENRIKSNLIDIALFTQSLHHKVLCIYSNIKLKWQWKRHTTTPTLKMLLWQRVNRRELLTPEMTEEMQSLPHNEEAQIKQM